MPSRGQRGSYSTRSWRWNDFEQEVLAFYKLFHYLKVQIFPNTCCGPIRWALLIEKVINNLEIFL